MTASRKIPAKQTTKPKLMVVKLLFFAGLRERVGRGTAEMALPARTSAAAILAAVTAAWPGAAAILPACRVAINDEFVDGRVRLKCGDEVAILPPVAGG